MAISSDLIFRFRLQRLSLAFRCPVSREWPSAEPEVLASNLKKREFFKKRNRLECGSSHGILTSTHMFDSMSGYDTNQFKQKP